MTEQGRGVLSRTGAGRHVLRAATAGLHAEAPTSAATDWAQAECVFLTEQIAVLG